MTTSHDAPPRAARLLSAAGLAVFGTLCVVYIVSQYLRNTIGVIAPELAVELKLSAVEIGLLSSAFFFAFAAAQLPLGVALDRFGPKRCILVCVALIVLGSALFAYAAGASGLIAGRVLLGLGSASFLMAPLALYARWFAPERFSTLAGIHLGIGSLGTLLATAPYAIAVAAVGWRATFVGVAIVTVCMGVLVVLMVKDDPPGRRPEPHRETLRENLAGVLQAIRTPSIGRLFLVHLSGYSSFILIVGLWGGPYLTHIYGYDLKGRGDLLFVAGLAQIVGSFFWGPMDRVFGRHKPPVLVGAGMTVAVLATLALVGKPTVPALIALFAVLGFASALTPLLIAHGKSLFPPHILGRGLTLMNTGTMGGVFLSQTISGAVIELFPAANGAYPLDAYRVVFALQAAFLLIACLAYARARDPGRGRGEHG